MLYICHIAPAAVSVSARLWRTGFDTTVGGGEWRMYPCFKRQSACSGCFIHLRWLMLVDADRRASAILVELERPKMPGRS